MDHYWTEQHDNAIRDYYYATSHADRCRIIDKQLSAPLYELAKRCLIALCVPPDFEYQQDIVIHLVTKSMPKLTEDKLQGALQFLWMSARNFTLTYIRLPKDFKTMSLDHLRVDMQEDIEDMNIYCTEAYIQRMYFTDTAGPTVDAIDLDAEAEKEAVHHKVMDEIDIKLKGQHIVNTTNSVYLMLLRQYLIDNDYDVRGFGEFVMGAMHLKLSTYRAISGRLGFRTRDFNEKLLK